MRPYRSRIVVMLVLTVCLVCPILEVFDTWDPPMQSGNDTEYSLMIAVLCMGAAYFFGRSSLESPHKRFVAGRTLAFGMLGLFISKRHFDLGFSDTSPPALPLRI